MKLDLYDYLIYCGVSALSSVYFGVETYKIEIFCSFNRLQLGSKYYIFQIISLVSWIVSIYLILRIHKTAVEQLS